MKIIIIGPVNSGKTTMLRGIVRENPHIDFHVIMDEYMDGLVFPPEINFIITSIVLDNIPHVLRNNAVILNLPIIRGML